VILYWNHYLQGEDGNQKIAKRPIEKPHKVRGELKSFQRRINDKISWAYFIVIQNFEVKLPNSPKKEGTTIS
jgi:hypothetical protein